MLCVICSLLMFVSDASGDHMLEMYLSMGLVIALSICIVLRASVVVISMCLLYVSLGVESHS